MLHPRRNFNWQYWLKLVCASLAYAFSSRLVLAFFDNGYSTASLFFIPSGVGLATVLIGGFRYAPSIFFGATISGILGGFNLWTAIGTSSGSMLGAIAGAYCLTKKTGHFDSSFSALSNWWRLIILGGCLGCSINGINGATFLLSANIIKPESYFIEIVRWWMGDTFGVIVMTPFVLSWWQSKHLAIQPKQLAEALFVTSLTLLVGQAVFLNWFHDYLNGIANHSFWMFLFITWVAVRLELCWLTLIILIISLQVLAGLYSEFGVFSYYPLEYRGFIYWCYILVLSIVGMTLNTYIATIKRLYQAQQETSKQLQQIAEHFPGVVYQYRLNPDGSSCFPYASPGIKDIYRVTPEQVQHNAEAVFSVLHPEDKPRILESIQKSADELQPWQCEYRVRFDDEQIRWLLSHSVPYREPEGATVWHGFIKDITDVKQKEVEYRTIIEASFSGFFCQDLQGNILSVNSALCRMLGYSEQELLSMSIIDIEAIENYAATVSHIQKIVQTGHDIFETRHKCKNGSIIDVEISVLYMEELGKRFFVFVNDITERKQIETQLRNSEQNFRRLLENAPVGMAFIYHDGRVNFINKRFTSLVGYTLEDVPTIHDWWQQAYPDPEYRQWAYQNWQKIAKEAKIANRDTETIERNITCKDGSVKVMLISAINFPDGWLTIFVDITERKRAEDALKANEAFTISILNSLTAHIAVLDTEGNIIMVNEAWKQFAKQNNRRQTDDYMDTYNYLSVCQRSFDDTNDPAITKVIDGIQAVLNRTKANFHFEYPCHCSIEYRWFQMTVSPLQGTTRGVVISHENITQRKQAENALLDNQALLKTAQKAARMGHYVINIAQGTWTNDALFDEIFGIPTQHIRELSYWQQLIYIDDYQRVMDYFSQSIARLEELPAIEYRIVRPSDGAICWISAWGYNSYDEQGQALQQVGMVQEITERKLAEQQLQQTTEQLQLVLEGGHLGFWDWNIATGEVQRNHIWSEMLGYTFEEMQETVQQWEDFVHVEDRQKAWQSINAALAGRTPYHELEYRMYHKDGSIRWILDHASVVQRDAAGQPTRMSGIHVDITPLKQLEEQLRESEAFFQSLAHINPVGIYQTNAKGECIFLNPKGCEILDMTPEQALGDGWVSAIMKEDMEKVYDEWKAAVYENRPFALEYRFQHQDGKIVWAYGQATAIRDKQGQLSGYVGTITDITERKAAEDYINQLAFYDSLTQLPNRRLLYERLKHGIALNHRTGYSKMALLMMDLDKFKSVNDSLGHAAGDELLQQVAQRIKVRLREVDTVARLGGDEFVILMENITHEQQAAYLAESLIHTLSQSFTLCQNHEVYIGASIGIAIHPQHGNSIEILMDNADMALYHAKEQGRGCFAYFSDALTEKTRERIELEIKLRKALEQHELHLYLQPQIDIQTGQLIGAEALTRWFDPIQGFVMPKNFIPIAEETGLIVNIGEWVLRETCRYGQKWLKAGHSNITLSVNVSPYQFRHCDMDALVGQILKETGFPAQNLILEFTETGLMSNQQNALTILNKLLQRGIQFAIDGFGTGYSSFSHLKHLPISLVKIDKTFIDHIPEVANDNAIVSSIIAMAHHLGFKVLAEGVENAAQLTFLQQVGCDKYQGCLYSAAISAEQFEKLLQKNRQ